MEYYVFGKGAGSVWETWVQRSQPTKQGNITALLYDVHVEQVTEDSFYATEADVVVYCTSPNTKLYEQAEVRYQGESLYFPPWSTEETVAPSFYLTHETAPALCEEA